MNKLLDNTWYHIPGFNGYVINTSGDVKSLKFMNANPDGIPIKYYNNKNGGYYILSDDKNVRRKRTKEELLDIVRNNKSLYIFKEGTIYMGSRNKGFMNYNKYYKSNMGKEIKINIRPQVIELPEEKNITLSFPSLQNFYRQSEPMVRFY